MLSDDQTLGSLSFSNEYLTGVAVAKQAQHVKVSLPHYLPERGLLKVKNKDERVK